MPKASVSEDPPDVCGAPYNEYVGKLRGRLHIVSRQYSCGIPMHFAHPLRIRVQS